jgi:NADH-quinone oxidoreductase subunit E
MAEPGLQIPVWQTGQPGVPARVVDADVEGPVLSDEARALAERITTKYPTRRSALMPLLYLVQSEAGWVPRRGMREVADILGLTTAEVEAVATFYTMLKLHPCGKFVLSICTNPSCALLGGRRLYDRARESLGPDAERMTEDGLFTLEEEECLAACDKAPVVALNYLFFDRVTEEQLEAMIASVREGNVPEASRGGVPAELKEISRTLAGLGSLPPAPSGGAEQPAEGEGAPGAMGEGPAQKPGEIEELRGGSDG